MRLSLAPLSKIILLSLLFLVMTALGEQRADVKCYRLEENQEKS